MSVDRVVMVGEPDFLPTDPNWIQVRIRLENIGLHTIKLVYVKGRLTDGTVIASAQSVAEILKPPSLVNSQLATVGLGAGGMMLGMIFPPAAIASGAAIVFGPAIMRDRMQKKAIQFNQVALRAEPIASGTTSAGYVFVPAVKGQTGLIIFYEVDGRTQTLAVPRISQ